MIAKLEHEFKNIYSNGSESHLFFAPGRINLIGEHLDYNGGFVLPAAISFGTYALVRKRDDTILRFSSLNFKEEGIIECTLNDLTYNKAHKWANYPKGMIKFLKDKGFSISSGLDILFYGNIPSASGLSSSASIEMVTGVLLKQLFNLHINQEDIAKIGQFVENKYIGVNSGIMDQFSIVFGKKDHAILLNCENLHYEYAPIKLKEHIIMIIHTNKQRALSESKYNERRVQCENALRDLQDQLDIKNLCKLTPKVFEQTKHIIKDETDRKRAHHIVYEQARTKEAYQQLQDSDLVSFGKLMNDSHDSLQHYYEVTGFELDTIVEAAQSQVGVLGARMTGAGFGGCAIALVEKAHKEQFTENVTRKYIEKVGYNPIIYEATISDGARQMKGVK